MTLLGFELLFSNPLSYIALHTSEMAKEKTSATFLPPFLSWHENTEKTVHSHQAPCGEVQPGGHHLGLGTLPELPELANQRPCEETVSVPVVIAANPGFLIRRHLNCPILSDYAGCLHHL